MSKRNFILLIIILIIITLGVFGFLYLRPQSTTPGDNGTGTNFFSGFNPFGNKTTSPVVTPPADISGYVPPVTTPLVENLTKVSTMPIAGFTVFPKERLKDITPTAIANETTQTTGTTKKVKTPPAPLTEFAPALRYVAKATGYIYETFADNIQEEKFSQTVVPKVYDAYFGNSAQSVIMRYLKPDGQTIETFVGTLPKELLGTDPTGTNELKGTFLPDNVKSVSISPDTSKAFYLFDNGNDMVGTTLNFTDNKKVQLLDSPFTEWTGQWGNNTMISLSTKPSATIPGYMYTISSLGKNLSKVLGGTNGLTTLTSPNGKLILYSNNNLVLSLYHTDTRNSDILSVKTLPEKCVWGNASDVVYCAVPKSVDTTQEYPDAWYQGEISFNDQIWKIDVKTGNATMISDPATVSGGREMDGIKLALDGDQNYFFFVNKKDSFLWELKLK